MQSATLGTTAARTTILLLTANPSGTTRLRLPNEVRDIKQGLALSAGHERFNIVSEWAVRAQDLRRALLKHQPQIVHFSGHGEGEQGLIFEDDAGEVQPIRGAALADLFGLFPSVNCVLLNACYSEVQATAIVTHVNYVVGMRAAIGDRAAIEFSVGFYDAIGYHRPIPEAYEFGRSAIALKGIDEVSTPILLVKSPVATVSDAASADADADADADATPPISEPPISEPPTPEPPTPDLPPVSVDAELPLVMEEPEGLVPLDSHFYIERSPIETDCYETVTRLGSLIRIKAPKQMGKTSLLVRTLNHAKAQGLQTVRLSFQAADSQSLNSLDEFLQWFCASVTEDLDREDRLADYWKGARGIVRSAQRYFEKYLLAELDRPLVLGLDDVDVVFEHEAIAKDFFGMLRVWHEEGKSHPVWRKLHLIIVHSKEVYIPLDINRSPFNVGLPVELRELNAPEVETLIARHQLAFTADQQQLLIALVGGHPYLLRTVLYQLKRGRITLSQLLSEAPTESGLFRDHLRRHLLNLEANPALVEGFQQVIQSSRPVQIGSTEAF
ncbi:MAG: AAA-like domain-containing protein, partial [Phormidesmis sp.]